MTRKDYTRVASILNGVRDKRERQRLAEEFARWFREDNQAFDAERFSSAVFDEPRGSTRRSGSVRRSRSGARRRSRS